MTETVVGEPQRLRPADFKSKRVRRRHTTDAVFANVQAVHARYQDDRETLEISVDAKAKVSEGEYSRGGKMPERLPGLDAQGA
jgi:hypothetical protein